MMVKLTLNLAFGILNYVSKSSKQLERILAALEGMKYSSQEPAGPARARDFRSGPGPVGPARARPAEP